MKTEPYMAKAPENIEAFQRMVGAILGRLYETHPEELSWDVDEFFGEDVPPSSAPNMLSPKRSATSVVSAQVSTAATASHP